MERLPMIDVMFFDPVFDLRQVRSSIFLVSRSIDLYLFAHGFKDTVRDDSEAHKLTGYVLRCLYRLVFAQRTRCDKVISGSMHMSGVFVPFRQCA